MYLKKLGIKHFRCIKELSLSFHKGVNILIGENNSGKTAIIDALRVCFSLGNQHRDIFISANDFHVDTQNPIAAINDIEFDLFFEIENDDEGGIFLEMLSLGDGGYKSLQLHLRYFMVDKKGLKKVKYKLWGGDNEGQSVSAEVLELLYSVYLGALRDAVNSLRPVRGNIIGNLYSNIEADPDKQKALADKVHNLLSSDREWQGLIKNGVDTVNEHLEKSSIKGKSVGIEIDFLPPDFRRILDSLRIQIPIFESIPEGAIVERKYFNLNENGLGYNNLIYIGVVLGDLVKRKGLEPESYISLLIEEPEAHLHPQLQNTLFSYLNEINTRGIQIFITSHSPSITAKANLNSLIVIQNQNSSTYALPVEASSLDERNKKYLHKFLDVTKSQLFFANGVILVEGISEALLLPIFSKIMGADYDIEKHGVEIVNINGVAFEHFGKLFNADDPSQRLRCRCAILTDDDRSVENDEISSRAAKAKGLERESLKVMLAEETFEFELLKSGNKDRLLQIFKGMHPRAAQNLAENDDINAYARAFVEKVSDNKAKSELAHRLSVQLAENAEGFVVPDYIQNAIRWVVKGE